MKPIRRAVCIAGAVGVISLVQVSVVGGPAARVAVDDVLDLPIVSMLTGGSTAAAIIDGPTSTAF